MANHTTGQPRSDAAARGWDTRRRKQAQASELPDYGAPGAQPPESTQDDTKAQGYEMPASILAIAGNAAQWDDPLFMEDADAYLKLLTSIPVTRSLAKLGIRTARMDWLAMGPDDEVENDPVQEQLQAAIDQAHFWTDMVCDLTAAKVTGWLAMQMFKGEARTGDMVVPSFKNGRRHKWQVSGPHVGTVHHDGKRLIEVERVTGVGYREKRVLDTSTRHRPFQHFMLHKPGTSSSPEGDLTTAFTLYPLAKASADALTDIRKYMKLYALPLEIIGKNIDKLRPDQAARVLRTTAEALGSRHDDEATRGKPFGAPLDLLVSLIEPRGQGFSDMMEYMRWQEAVSDQILLGNTLTSKVDDAGRTGDTSVHMMEEDDKIWFNATQIAETLNTYLIPWLARHNGWDLTGYYIWPAPAGSRARAMADDGGNPDEGDLDANLTRPKEPQTLPSLAAIFDEQQRRYMEFARGTVRLSADEGRWVTINGTPVFIEDGVITKGPAGMRGKKPDEVGDKGRVGKVGDAEITQAEKPHDKGEGAQKYGKQRAATREIMADVDAIVKDVPGIRVERAEIASTGSGYVEVSAKRDTPLRIVNKFDPDDVAIVERESLFVRISDHSSGGRASSDRDRDVGGRLFIWTNDREAGLGKLKKALALLGKS